MTKKNINIIKTNSFKWENRLRLMLCLHTHIIYPQNKCKTQENAMMNRQLDKRENKKI